MRVEYKQPWVEKYRPKSVADVAYQEEVTRALKTAIETGVMPHLLFYGPPGTGKTSTILAVARTLFGPELYKKRILELNASDERGIKVVREKVKAFAQGAIGSSEGSSSVHSCPPFKIIVLDEADTMTVEAQGALRRTMETYSKVTRFCLICNYVTRIIDPLASRCAKFRFRALNHETMQQRMDFIAGQEGVQIDKDGIKAIIDLSGGDMRKAVTTLQSAQQLVGARAITTDELAELTGMVPNTAVAKIWDAIRWARFHRKFEAVSKSVDDFMCEGFPVSSLLLRLLEDTINSEFIQDERKAPICERLALADKQMLDGASEDIQLLDVLALMQRSCV
ncbi:unnamed protein product [Chrysoparadoxa australica]